MIHASYCATNNAPALPTGPCDCGLDLALDAALHGRIAPLVTWAGGHGFFVENVGGKTFVQAHQFPRDRFAVGTPTANLKDAHQPITLG